MKRAARRKSSSGRASGSPSTHRSGPRKTIFELPPLELECMKALWARGEATVRDIREQLAADSRPLAYTTVETIMDRLTRKGAVVRQRVGRAHRYTPVYQKAEARAQALAAVADHFFDGSRAALAAHLNGSAPTSRTARPAAPALKPAAPSSTRRPALEPLTDTAIDTSLL